MHRTIVNRATDGARSCRAILLGLVLAVALGAPASAEAAACAGFTDVDDADPFCPNVEWVRNRNVTLGCTATAYCPTATVSRLAMAAFLRRLGAALTPVQLRIEAASGMLDVDASPVICQSEPFDTTTFPRRATVDATLAALAAADVDVRPELVMSASAGASWTVVGAPANPMSLAMNRWTTHPALGQVELAHGLSVRFGIRVGRGGLPGTADVTDSQCQLRVLIFSRDGTSSPF